MAAFLAESVADLPGVTISQKVDANALFVIIPPHAVEPLRAKYRFYTWSEDTGELRWMCSFDTTREDVMDFVGTLKSLII